jgi:hypothetical protein
MWSDCLLLWNPTGCNVIHKSQISDIIVSQFNVLYAFTPEFFSMHFYINFLASSLFPCYFPANILYAVLTLGLGRLMLGDLITLAKCREFL